MADKDAIRNESMQSALEFQRNFIAANNSGAIELLMLKQMKF